MDLEEWDHLQTDFDDTVRRLSAFVARMVILQLIAELSILQSPIPPAASGLFRSRPGVERRPP